MRSLPRLVATVGLLVLACGAERAGSAGAISGQELAALLAAGEAPLVLDVRSRAEFEAGHIPGAVNVPHDELAERTGELALDPSDEVVVHCHTGRRAEMAGETLRALGYTRVRQLSGHWVGWQADGLATD